MPRTAHPPSYSQCLIARRAFDAGPGSSSGWSVFFSQRDHAGKPDHCLMAPGDKKTNRDLARSTTICQTLVETKTICSQNEDNWTSAAVRRAVALRSRTPGGLSSHQRGASSSSARQRAGMSHAGGRPAWSGPPVRPRQSFQAALRAGTSVASTRGERLEGC